MTDYALAFLLGGVAAIAVRWLWARFVACRVVRPPETESERYMRESGGYGLEL